MSTMMKEAIQALYPPRPAASRRRVRRSGSSSSRVGGGGASFHEGSLHQYGGPDAAGAATGSASLSRSSSSYGSSSSSRKSKGRFSELLLEHGERELFLDYAATASSSPLSQIGEDVGGSCQMGQIEGRLRVCSQSIVFEPRQASRGIVRIPFRHMTACPFLGGGSADPSATYPGAGGVNLDVDGAFNGGAQAIGQSHAPEAMAVIIRCERHVVMKANNTIGPYHYAQSPVEFRFQFRFSSPAYMLSLSKQLFEAEASNKKSSSVSFAPSVAFDTSAPPTPIIPLPSNNDPRDAIIEQVIDPTINRSFDTTSFLHAQEQPITPSLPCSIKIPLLEEKGCAILTDCGLYFQPMVASGLIDTGANHDLRPRSNGKAQVWLMDDMRAIARRYDGLKDKGLEIYFAKQRSVLLAFESTAVRERMIGLISQHVSEMKSRPLPCFTNRSFVESALEMWISGDLDNFEYLLCLNAASGRSFHDLSRYPVFPWVLSRYGEKDDDDILEDLPTPMDFTDPNMFRDLSKPIGALSDERFAEFGRRYESMVQQQRNQTSQNQDAPFMYGTHYCAPGYVLFYLLRVMPEHMLCLQNGKFDIPDRLFHSIDATYKSIQTNPADVKELIPEFFDADCFDFLINSMGLQLGNLQTGERVNDVILPPWAKNAKHFLRQNRAALESDYCTKHLPKWIDLIFGAKSRGSGAKHARNLFHPMSYIGPEDFEGILSAEDKARAELQSAEFGIVPDQLFCRAHPSKSESIGSWGDADELLTRDHLRESYGGFGKTAQQGRVTPGFSGDGSLEQNGESVMRTTAGNNPFD
ncbi:hypothetical protein ACHAWF_006383 [Thalassiosira exigua]